MLPDARFLLADVDFMLAERPANRHFHPPDFIALSAGFRPKSPISMVFSKPCRFDPQGLTFRQSWRPLQVIATPLEISK
jgi:hypothetical protein